MLFSLCNLPSKFLLSLVFAVRFASPVFLCICPIGVELAIDTSSVDRFYVYAIVPSSICFVFLLFSLEIAVEFASRN